MPFEAGAAQPVTVDTTGGERLAGPAIPVYVASGGPQIAGPARRVVVVADGPIEGRAAVPIYNAGAGAVSLDAAAQPVFVVSGAQLLLTQGGLLAEWRFDDGAGVVLTDYSGNGFHGALPAAANRPTWAGGGLTFDGSNDYVSLHSAGLAAAFNGQEGTIECVFKVANGAIWTDGTNKALLEIGANGTNVCRVRKVAAGGVTATYNSAGSLLSINAPTVEAQALYTAITYSKSADAFSFYLGATRINTLGGLGTFTGSLAAATTVAGASNSSGVISWSGTINYLRIHTRPLSAPDLAQNYAVLQAIMAGRGVFVA